MPMFNFFVVSPPAFEATTAIGTHLFVQHYTEAALTASNPDFGGYAIADGGTDEAVLHCVARFVGESAQGYLW